MLNKSLDSIFVQQFVAIKICQFIGRKSHCIGDEQTINFCSPQLFEWKNIIQK